MTRRHLHHRPFLPLKSAVLHWLGRLGGYIFSLCDDKFMPTAKVAFIGLPEALPVKPANTRVVCRNVWRACVRGCVLRNCGRCGVELEICMTCSKAVGEKVRCQDEEEEDEDQGNACLGLQGYDSGHKTFSERGLRRRCDEGYRKIK